MRGVKAISGHGVVSAVTPLPLSAVDVAIVADDGFITNALVAETRHRMYAKNFMLL